MLNLKLLYRASTLCLYVLLIVSSVFPTTWKNGVAACREWGKYGKWNRNDGGEAHSNLEKLFWLFFFSCVCFCVPNMDRNAVNFYIDIFAASSAFNFLYRFRWMDNCARSNSHTPLLPRLRTQNIAQIFRVRKTQQRHGKNTTRNWGEFEWN